MFNISPIPAFKDNYIWLLTCGQRAAVVDPGDPVPVIAQLEAAGMILDSILITHHHADHQGGVAALVERWNPAVYAPGSESITGCTRPLSGGETIQVLGQTISVMAVPGHTLGHLAYYVPGALFCGDTLFGAGCGRLFEGTPAQMAESLGKIAALPDETRIFCAHEYTELNLRFALAVEPDNEQIQARILRTAGLRAEGKASVPSLLSEEKATNPFLRCHVKAVAEAALRQSGELILSETDVFAAIRAWRNNF